MIGDLVGRPELALAAGLTVGLCWVVLSFWLVLRDVGDDVGARLDALEPAGLDEAPPADRYARFERRDYSGDRGVVPTGLAPAVARWGGLVVPRWVDFYAETCSRLGLDPMEGS